MVLRASAHTRPGRVLAARSITLKQARLAAPPSDRSQPTVVHPSPRLSISAQHASSRGELSSPLAGDSCPQQAEGTSGQRSGTRQRRTPTVPTRPGVIAAATHLEPSDRALDRRVLPWFPAGMQLQPPLKSAGSPDGRPAARQLCPSGEAATRKRHRRPGRACAGDGVQVQGYRAGMQRGSPGRPAMLEFLYELEIAASGVDLRAWLSDQTTRLGGGRGDVQGRSPPQMAADFTSDQPPAKLAEAGGGGRRSGPVDR